MHASNAGQPNLQEHVPRVSLIYRSAPVNYAKRGALWYSFCILFRGTILNFFQNSKIQKNVLPMIYFSELPNILPRIMKCPFQSRKTFFKTQFFAAEKNRLKPTIWRSKNRLK